MKKKISIILIVICISSLVSCGSSRTVINKRTELGDYLSFEFYLSGDMHGMYLTYDIFSKDYVGRVSRHDKRYEEIPANPLESFETIGAFGDTHFYKMFDNVFFIYDDRRLSDYLYISSLSDYKNMIQAYSREDKRDVLNSMSDLMKTKRFEFIYQFGEILAYENDDSMEKILVRYANFDYSEDDRRINFDSKFSEDIMTSWAKQLLEQYYSK